jgi:hypothetical protein
MYRSTVFLARGIVTECTAERPQTVTPNCASPGNRIFAIGFLIANEQALARQPSAAVLLSARSFWTRKLQGDAHEIMGVGDLCFRLFAAVSPAQETPRAEVSVGYSVVEVLEGYTFRMDGASSSVAWNANNWLGFVADWGIYHGSPGVSLTTNTYTFGPRFSYRHWNRFVPFAQVLAGGAHASAITSGFTDSSNAFAPAAGAGADIVLDRRAKFALRPQMEYFAFHGNGGFTNNARMSLGLVFRFGAK